MNTPQVRPPAVAGRRRRAIDAGFNVHERGRRPRINARCTTVRTCALCSASPALRLALARCAGRPRLFDAENDDISGGTAGAEHDRRAPPLRVKFRAGLRGGSAFARALAAISPPPPRLASEQPGGRVRDVRERAAPPSTRRGGPDVETASIHRAMRLPVLRQCRRRRAGPLRCAFDVFSHRRALFVPPPAADRRGYVQRRRHAAIRVVSNLRGIR